MRLIMLSVLGVCVSLTAAAEVAAQAAPGLVEAKQHFERGMRAFAERDYGTAVVEFEAALADAPNAELWFNLARAHEELGHYEQARVAYERYLRDSVDPPDAAKVRARIAELEALDAAKRSERAGEAEVGTLRIRSNVDAATVMLDGRPIGQVPIAAPLSLQPGSYRIDVIHPGYVPFRAKVRIEPGMLTAAYADLGPLTRARARAAGRTWTWVTLGVTGALLVTGGALSAVAIAQQRDGNASDADRFKDGATLALGGAALCALVTAILYVGEGVSHTADAVGVVQAKRASLR